jgi:hypothetical protein
MFKLKVAKHRHQRIQHKIKKKLNNTSDTDDAIIKHYITMAEDEQTEMAKGNTNNACINIAHLIPTKRKTTLLQGSKNLGQLISKLTHRLIGKITNSNQHRVTFARQAMVAEFNNKVERYWSHTTWEQTDITSAKRVGGHQDYRYSEYLPRIRHGKWQSVQR